MPIVLKDLDETLSRAVAQAKQQVSLLNQQEFNLQKSIAEKNKELNSLDEEIVTKNFEVSGLQEKVNAANLSIKSSEKKSTDRLAQLEVELGNKEVEILALESSTRDLISRQQADKAKLIEIREDIRLKVAALLESTASILGNFLSKIDLIGS